MMVRQQPFLAHSFPHIPEVAAAAAVLVDRQHDLFDLRVVRFC